MATKYKKIKLVLQPPDLVPNPDRAVHPADVFLYPDFSDPLFNIKIAKIRGLIPEDCSDIISKADDDKKDVVKKSRLIGGPKSIPKKSVPAEKPSFTQRLMDLKKLSERLNEFSRERDWEQFHTPKNLATALSVEVSELLEIFQWSKSDGQEELVKNGEINPEVIEELGDILNYLVRFADIAGIDLEKAANDKIDINQKKYPIDVSKGNSVKYNKRK